MGRQLTGVVLLVVGLFLQIDELESVLLGGSTGGVGLAIAAVGLTLLLWRVNRQLVRGSVLIVVGLLLVPFGAIMGWPPIAESQPDLPGAAFFWAIAAVALVFGVRDIRRVFQERRRLGVPIGVLLPRSVWLFFSAALLVLAVLTNVSIGFDYYGFESIRCGAPPLIVFADRYHADVTDADANELLIPPSSEQVDAVRQICLILAQSAIRNGVFMLLGSAFLAFIGLRFGKRRSSGPSRPAADG